MDEAATFTKENRINHFVKDDESAFSKQERQNRFGQNFFPDDQMRGDQLSRQWRILRQIETRRRGLTAAEIAKENQVSLRTAYRDLDDLQQAGFPLYTETGPKGRQWKFVESYRFGVPEPFTFTELMSLHMSRDLFKVFKGTVFFNSLTSAFQKVQVTLPQSALAYLDRIESTFQMGVRPYKDYHRFRDIISKVNQAAVECRRIEILYLPLKRKIETHRKIDPYGVRFFEGTLYIIGFCHLRKKMRTFVVDRIKLLQLTDETFPRPADFDLEKYTRHSFKVSSGPLQTVIIRISPSWARYVGEKIWHESQSIRKMADKSLEMTFQVAGLDEIKQWILSLGAEATVIEPPDLKVLIKQDIEKMRKQYQDPLGESPPGHVIKINKVKPRS